MMYGRHGWHVRHLLSVRAARVGCFASSVGERYFQRERMMLQTMLDALYKLQFFQLQRNTLVCFVQL